MSLVLDRHAINSDRYRDTYYKQTSTLHPVILSLLVTVKQAETLTVSAYSGNTVIGIVTKIYLKVLIILDSDRSVKEQFFISWHLEHEILKTQKIYTWL